jgi:predicted nucleotidyltransferase
MSAQSPSPIDRAVSAAVEAIPGLTTLVLHGSHAAVRARPDSDLDFAAAAAAPIGRDCLNRARLAMEAASGRDVDLIDLRDPDVSSVLKVEAVRRGRRLIERDPVDFAFLESDLMAAFQDLVEAREPVVSALRETLRARAAHG